jgi:hypothetical protein
LLKRRVVVVGTAKRLQRGCALRGAIAIAVRLGITPAPIR